MHQNHFRANREEDFNKCFWYYWGRNSKELKASVLPLPMTFIITSSIIHFTNKYFSFWVVIIVCYPSNNKTSRAETFSLEMKWYINFLIKCQSLQMKIKQTSIITACTGVGFLSSRFNEQVITGQTHPSEMRGGKGLPHSSSYLELSKPLTAI